MDKKKKRELKVILFVLLIGVILTIIGITSYMKKDLNELKNLQITDVDFTALDDGTYTGSYKWSPVDAIVDVTIKDHVITEIDLVRHTTGQGAPAEIIPDKVVEKQSLDVDIVTGATYSSKVILKAIENALNSTSK